MSKFFTSTDTLTGDKTILAGPTKSRVEKFLRDRFVVEPATTDEVLAYNNGGKNIIPTDPADPNPTAADAVYAAELAQPSLPGKTFAASSTPAPEPDSAPFATAEPAVGGLVEHL